MQKSVSIVVCGNAGVVGDQLLRRRDIVTYWALTPEEAVAVVERVRPKVALVREEHALAVLDGTRRWRTPVVVLLEGDGWARREQYFTAGATALVQASAGDRILEAVSELTSLAFAKAPRALYETTVEVEIAGHSRFLETVNLSASGVCIAGIDAMEQSLGATVTFPLLDPPLTLQALVVRTHHDGVRDLGGLAFVNPSPQAEARLRALVEEEISHGDAQVTIDVPMAFDPITAALDEVSLAGEEAVDALKTKLRDLHHEAKRDGELHRKARPRAGTTSGRDIDAALSPSERAHVLGQPSPDWAAPALNTRLKLHVERKERGAPSQRTVRDALTLCRTLGLGAHDGPAMVEVAAVRASLLRDVYADAPRARHGASEGKADAVAGDATVRMQVVKPVAPASAAPSNVPGRKPKGRSKSVRA